MTVTVNQIFHCVCVCVEAAAACQTQVRKMIHCRIPVNVLNDGSGFFLLLIHPCIQLVGCVTWQSAFCPSQVHRQGVPTSITATV